MIENDQEVEIEIEVIKEEVIEETNILDQEVKIDPDLEIGRLKFFM